MIALATKRLSDMTVNDWSLYEWLDITPYGEPERIFIRGKERTPDEAVRQAEHFRKWGAMKEEEDAA